jgi:hypothetical protein
MSDEQSKRAHIEEIKQHALELHEFEQELGPDWEGTHEDLELLWNLREALARSVDKGELAEPMKEPELEPLADDAELLLAEIDDSPETDSEKKEEKLENAERPL